MKEPRILIVARRYPYPPTDGHHLRTYNLFKHFSSGYRFDLLTFGDAETLKDRERAVRQLGPCFEDVIVVPESSLKRVKQRGLMSRFANEIYPSKLTIGPPYYSAEMFEATTQRIDSGRYDLVFFAGYSMFIYFYREIGPVPYLVDIVDSLTLAAKSHLSSQRSVKDKIVSYRQYFWAKRYEQIHFRVARNLIFISDVDRASSSKHVPRSKTWPVSNGVDTDYFQPDPNRLARSNSLLFTGMMDFEPNKQAAMYFMRKILPRIAEREPSVTMTIAGGNPDAEIHALALQHPNVTVTGYVEDIRPYFDEASVCVCPLLSGAGVKNKILEAWAMAKPIVATSISGNGLDAVNGRNIMLADSPEDFANTTLSLLSDAGLRQKLGAAGRKTAEGQYSWSAQALALDSIIKEVLGGTRGESQRMLG